MIKNMLKRRKESSTYLATDSRHRWNVQMTMSTVSSQVGAALFPSFKHIFIKIKSVAHIYQTSATDLSSQSPYS